jgi:uncharacterized protein (TIGR03067 family)
MIELSGGAAILAAALIVFKENFMRRISIAVVAWVFTLMGVDCRADDVQDDFKASQGRWDLVYFEREGKEVEWTGRIQTIISPGKFIVKRGDEIIAAGTSTLDPTKNPKTLDSTYTEGPDKGKTFKGIYQLDGDTMKFCRPGSPDDARPTEFKTTPGSSAFVSVYKRAKPTDESKIVPQGLPPQFYTVTRIENGNIAFMTPELTKDGRAYQGGFAAIEDIDIYDGTGKKLTLEDFHKRVKVGSVVLATLYDDKPDPAYFRVLKDEAVVLVGALVRTGRAPEKPKE